MTVSGADSDSFARPLIPWTRGAWMNVTKEQLEACRRMVDVQRGNEAVVRSQFLTRLFEVLSNRSDDWRNAFIAGSEYLVHTGLRDGAGLGRVDTYYSNRVIEYEPDLRRKLGEAEAQLRLYAASLWSRFGPGLGELILIATDVHSWRFYRATPPDVKPGGRVSADQVVLEAQDAWDHSHPTDAELEYLVQMLERFLFGGVHPMTPEVLLRHFGPRSEVARRTVREISNTVARASQNSAEVQRALIQWQQAQESIMPGAPEPGLYARHLYLVLLTRLLAAEVLRRPGDDGRAAQLPLVLSGILFQQRARVTNFVDPNDSFAWISDARHAPAFLEIVRRLSAELTNFDPRPAGFLNVLSAIFDHFMPGEHRDLLGQRGTPDRLAESVVDAVLNDDIERPLLDPFCGDGRFVQAALRLKIAHYMETMEPAAVAERIVQDVMAADIDPVAVALTRLLYVLTAGDVLRHATVPVTLPVYHADVVFGRPGELPESLSTPRFALAMNPPWVAMSREPGIPYEAHLTRHAQDYGIRPTGSSGHHVELSTVAVLHTARRFLAEGARVGAILPRAIWNGNNHAAFREQEYTRVVPLTTVGVWDLIAVKGLFAVPSFVWFARRESGSEAAPNREIPARFWSGLGAGDGDRSGVISLRRLGRTSAWTEGTGELSSVRDYDHYPSRFAEGADLMPRASLFVERTDDNPGHQVVSVCTNAYERTNSAAKMFRGQTFTGMIAVSYLFDTITSLCLLPFRVLPPWQTALPVRRSAAGEIEIVDEAEMDEFSRRYFTEVDLALAFERANSHKPIRARIDFRRKLRAQRQPSLDAPRTVVVSGMGGAHPCAGVLRVPAGSAAPIFDQTVYYAYVSLEDEAYYLMGMLNSGPLDELIAAFQSTGLFGRRHVHEIAYRPIPPFDSSDKAHQDLVVAARELERRIATDLPDEVESAVRAYEGNLGKRRRCVRDQFRDGWESLNMLAAQILSSGAGE